MAFMTPHYTNEPFIRVSHTDGGSWLIPEGFEGPNEIIEGHFKGKWFCRLSADGYMDCTSWDGPFDTLEQAKTAIIDAWDVDPETGDELEDVA